MSGVYWGGAVRVAYIRVGGVIRGVYIGVSGVIRLVYIVVTFWPSVNNFTLQAIYMTFF